MYDTTCKCSFQGCNTDWLDHTNACIIGWNSVYYLSAWDHYLNIPWHVSNTVHFSHSVNVNNTNSRPYWPQQDASEESKDFAFGMANLFRQTGALLSITTACIWLWSDTGKNWNMVTCLFWKSLFVYSIMLKPVLTWVSQTLFSLSVCQSVTHHNMLLRFPDESSELYIIQSESEYSIFQTVCVGFCHFMQTWFSQVQKPLFFTLWAVWHCDCVQWVSHSWRNIEPQWSQTKLSQTLNQPYLIWTKAPQTQHKLAKDKVVPTLKTSKFLVFVGFQEVGQSGSRSTHKMNWTEWFRQTTDIGGKMLNMIQIVFAGSVISFWKDKQMICCSMTIQIRYLQTTWLLKGFNSVRWQTALGLTDSPSQTNSACNGLLLISEVLVSTRIERHDWAC